ncbi:hypothetical protein DFA_07151 [Cavenderia fasciculata]|uniref:Transmembrane protein n=1 Tax=Cavenderia fasciculata TaxID=261658 RepID=F4PVM1_CACFS|nr:uncharacterized protein DFA_07151 [Cavenderia fasciculata]EGG20035.1 hypothetical protein DFA_07151 [Cavenderia fasciculata]|eukprot:XP_004367018.1 hypothetical protein DFA_07151 [Cavenderia fasciculata]
MNNFYHNTFNNNGGGHYLHNHSNSTNSSPVTRKTNGKTSSSSSSSSSSTSKGKHNHKYYQQQQQQHVALDDDDDDDDSDVMTDSLDEYYKKNNNNNNNNNKKRTIYTNNNNNNNNNTDKPTTTTTTTNVHSKLKKNKSLDSIVNNITLSINTNPNFYSSDDDNINLNLNNNNTNNNTNTNNNNIISTDNSNNTNNNNSNNNNESSINININIDNIQQQSIIDIPTTLPISPRSPSISVNTPRGGVSGGENTNGGVDNSMIDYEADDEFEEGGEGDGDGNNESDEEDAKEFKRKLLAAIASPKKLGRGGSGGNFKGSYGYGYEEDEDGVNVRITNSTSTTMFNQHFDHMMEEGDQMDCDEVEDLQPQESRLKHILTMDALYLIIFIPVCYFSYYLPSIYLGSSDALVYWDYNFQWSKYILWISSIILGFSYVSLVTEARSYPFHCRYQRHRDFFQLLFAVSLLYLIAPSRTLMGPSDGTTIQERSGSSSSQETITPGQPVNHNQKTIYEAFVFNYFSFIIPFVVALHYTYLDHNLFLRSVGDKFGTPSLWKTYTFKEVIVIIPIVLFIISLVVWHVFLIIKDHLWIYYLIAYGLFFGILISVSCAIHKNYYLHLHHYFIFGSLIPFATFNNPLTSISLGLISGITVEGCARWSMGWIWYRAPDGVRIL